MKESIRRAIGNAPKKPGVYLWKTNSGKILYIGKAENLRNRLRNYLNPADAKTIRLVEKSHNLETILTKTDTEALILEDALVKQNQPRYNVLLRDDKRYPYLKITVRDKYPRIDVVRRVEPDGSRYFGPYTDVKSVRKLVNVIGELFGVRNCKHDLDKLKRPCIRYSMGKCAAPKLVMDKKQYSKRVLKACEFLSREYEKIKKDLLKDIKRLSETREYEKANDLKSILDSVDSISRIQDVSSSKLPDMDVLGYAQLDGKANITLLKVRNHKVVALLHYPLKGEYCTQPDQSMKAFIKQHYSMGDLTPKLIVTSCEPDDRMLLERTLSDIAGASVKILFARRGQKRKLVEMALQNSIHQLKQEKLENEVAGRAEALKKALGLRKKPTRIEGYDISNIGGKHTVGGMVVFTHGKADKSQYRRFAIEGAVQDDPGNMAQMIKRRFKHPEWEKPGLILLDGGLAQLNSCIRHIPSDVFTLALAKRDEEIYVPGKNSPLKLEKNDPALLLLREIRDEAHRFSRAYHKNKRGKNFLAAD